MPHRLPILIASFLIACSTQSGPQDSPAAPPHTSDPSASGAAKGASPAHTPQASGSTEETKDVSTPKPSPPVGETEKATLARDNNAFAASIYDKIRARGSGNLVFSPSSISAAFAMAYAGARGETREEMRQVLRFSLPDARLHPIFGAELTSWRQAGERNELSVANRLFGNATYRIEMPFLEVTRTSYAAPIEPVDFTTQAEAARKRINTWVADNTRQKILDLLPPGSIDGMTRLVIANAVYFKGAWQHAFEPKSTLPRAFDLADGKQVDVPMMQQTGSFKTGKVDGGRLLEVPYAGGALAMDIVLPDTAAGLPGMEAKFAGGALESWLAALAPQRLRVALPRFKIAPEESIPLKPVLAALGMKQAFDERKADFTGISRGEEVFISDAFHKAFVEVNEVGTVAAAATGIAMRTRSMRPEEPPSFEARRPFLFLLRDTRSGSVLFLGRVTDPR